MGERCGALVARVLRTRLSGGQRFSMRMLPNCSQLTLSIVRRNLPEFPPTPMLNSSERAKSPSTLATRTSLSQVHEPSAISALDRSGLNRRCGDDHFAPELTQSSCRVRIARGSQVVVRGHEQKTRMKESHAGGASRLADGSDRRRVGCRAGIGVVFERTDSVQGEFPPGCFCKGGWLQQFISAVPESLKLGCLAGPRAIGPATPHFRVRLSPHASHRLAKLLSCRRSRCVGSAVLAGSRRSTQFGRRP